MRLLLWFAGVVAFGYGLIVLLMYLNQRSFLYFPERERTAPPAAGFAAARELTLETTDGERVIAWHLPPEGDRPVVLYFQGNGGSLRLRAERFAALTADGTGLVALSYRGYGGSSGTPSEQGFIRDAEAAYRFAAEHYPARRIVPWGEALGTAIAVATAAEHPTGGLILESPFTSTADVAASIYWFLPVRLLMQDQFHSDARIGRVTAPVLVMHGDHDATVPIGYGERLFAMIKAPKQFVRFAGGGHSDLDSFGALEAAREFLKKL
jgi:uncharacterized protein